MNEEMINKTDTKAEEKLINKIDEKVKEILLEEIKHNIFNKSKDGSIIPKQLKKDLELAMAVAKKNGYYLNEFDNSVYNNKNIMLEAIKSNSHALNYASDNLFNDKEFVMEALKINGHMLWKVSNKLTDDMDIVLTAIENDPSAIRFASDRVKQLEKVKNKIKEVLKKQENKNNILKNELEKKIEFYKSKSIWWEDKNIVNNSKLSEEVTANLIEQVQNNLGIRFPDSYIKLIKIQNGGRLIKQYYKTANKIYVIDSIYGLSLNNNLGILKENYYNRELINFENTITFGQDDSGHMLYLFDFSDLNNNNEPKIKFYDNEIGNLNFLSNSFEEFINNLKIREEIDLLYMK